MNRAGIGWLTEDTGKIIIAVLCVVILLGFAAKLYSFVSSENEGAKMKTQLETLTLAVSAASTEKQEKIVELFPQVGWYLRSFPDNDFPQGECRGGVGCICFCKTVDCTTTRACSPFSFDVMVDATETERIFGDPQIGGEASISSRGSLALQSIEQLRIFPREKFIIINRAEQKK